MAATTAVAEHIDSGLRVLLADVDDLSNVAAEWDDWPDGERASFCLRWDHLMATYLTELDQRYRSGEMDDGQRAAYQALLRKLDRALPLVEQLNLYRPPMSLSVSRRRPS